MCFCGFSHHSHKYYFNWISLIIIVAAAIKRVTHESFNLKSIFHIYIYPTFEILDADFLIVWGHGLHIIKFRTFYFIIKFIFIFLTLHKELKLQLKSLIKARIKAHCIFFFLWKVWIESWNFHSTFHSRLNPILPRYWSNQRNSRHTMIQT